MLERRERLADGTDRHIQEIRGIRHMSLIDHPISQPSLDIFLIWNPIITADVRKRQIRPL
jgi:hypothetical protein